MNQRNALLFIGIFVALLILVIGISFLSAIGSKEKPPVLPEPESTTTSAFDTFPVFSTAPTDTATTNDQSSVNSSNQNSAGYPGSNPGADSQSAGSDQNYNNPTPTGNTSGQGQTPLSSTEAPLKGKLIFSTVNNAYDSSTPNDEYIMLQAPAENTGKILISGLILKSIPTGNTVTIGNGVYLPYSGVINPSEPIYLAPGETVVISSGSSPTGYSFRLNKCFGYFAQFQSFTPGIYTNCPLLRNEPKPQPPNALEDACLDYLDSYQSCHFQTEDPDYLSPSCNSYIHDKANYSYCVSAHKSDSDFYQPEWRVYLNRNQTLWKNTRETIVLQDKNGKTIDTYTY